MWIAVITFSVPPSVLRDKMQMPDIVCVPVCVCVPEKEI